jgi:hypothetical protein
MTAAILGTFVILWLPYEIALCIELTGRYRIFSQYLRDVGVILGTTNHCLNWIIYGAMCRDFRHAAWRGLTRIFKRSSVGASF